MDSSWNQWRNGKYCQSGPWVGEGEEKVKERGEPLPVLWGGHNE